MYDICTWVYVFTCMWVHMYLWYFWVEAQGWYWKSSLVVLPLYSVKTGSLSRWTWSSSIPASLEPVCSRDPVSTFRGWNCSALPCPPAIPWGSGIWTFHLLACLQELKLLSPPPTPAFPVSGRLYLPQFTKLENRSCPCCSFWESNTRHLLRKLSLCHTGI